MPEPPLPAEVEALLRKPNPAVVASIRQDGTPHAVATWYEWRGGRILLSMDKSRARLRFIRANPAVAITVLDGDDWYRSVSLFGRVVELCDDEGLADIDALAQRYLATPYPDRAHPRVTAWVDIDRWSFWNSYRETEGLDGVAPS